MNKKTHVLVFVLLSLSFAALLGCASSMSTSDKMLWEGIDNTNAPAANPQ